MDKTSRNGLTRMFRRVTLLAVSFLAAASSLNAQRNWSEYKQWCESQGGIAYPNPPRCEPKSSPSSGNSSSNSNAEASRRAEEERRAREEADAESERAAEEKRKKDKAEADAKFARERDEAAKTLKGSSGTASTNDFGLKGSGGATDLRDAVAEPGLKGSTGPTMRDTSKQALAWRQVHCAASVFKYALNAISSQNVNYEEYGLLSAEAMKSVDGAKVDVQCEVAPNVPTVGGEEVDVDKLRAAQKSVIERANLLVQRMKQTQASKPAQATTEPSKPAAAPAPCTGTKMERMRCTQQRLNEVNSKKIEGQSTAQITEEEKNRAELAKLVLINNGLEKGDLSVTVDTTEETTTPRRPRRHAGKP
jgi:hypothetical protein